MTNKSNIKAILKASAARLIITLSIWLSYFYIINALSEDNVCIICILLVFFYLIFKAFCFGEYVYDLIIKRESEVHK